MNQATGQSILSKFKKKQKQAAPMIEQQADMPEDFEGIQVITTDFIRQEPCDFLLTSKIQKRNQLPLTVGELVHSGRKASLLKLEHEIKNL